ncbi:MAG: tetratricopeptide repeat protein [Candidatus Eisenbacteria bacterium]
MLLALLPYLNCLGNGYVYDDNFLILKHPALVGPFDLAKILAAPYWGEIHSALLWRPLTTLSFSLGPQLGIDSAFLPHLINLALHALVTVLWYRLLLRLFAQANVAWAAAAIFAVHPLHTEAVTWISGRAELLCGAFSLAALHLALSEERRLRWLSPLAVLLAVGAKESAITLPMLLFAIGRTGRPAQSGPASSSRRAPTLGLALASLIPIAFYVVLRHQVLGSWSAPATDAADNPMIGTNLIQRFPTILDCAGRYLGLTLWPARLAADYSAPVLSLLRAPTGFMGLGAIALLGLVALTVRRRERIEGWGATFTLISYAVASNVPVPIGTIFAERLFYLPSAGLILVCVAAVAALARSRPALLRPALALLVVVIVAGAARTWVRNVDWRDEASFFKAGAAAQPKSPKLQAGVAVVFNREHRPEEALAQAAMAMQLDPTALPQRETYAATLELLGRTDEALAFLRDVVARDPRDRASRKRLLVLLDGRGMHDEATAVAADGLAKDPGEIYWSVAAAKAAQSAATTMRRVPRGPKWCGSLPTRRTAPLYHAFCLLWSRSLGGGEGRLRRGPAS